MCELWQFRCGHTKADACHLPKAVKVPGLEAPYDPNVKLALDKQATDQSILPTLKLCPGITENTPARVAVSLCFHCIQDQVAQEAQKDRPEVDAMKHRRMGAGNDNWGFSSRGMQGFGEAGNSSWMQQYPRGDATGLGFVRVDRIGAWPWVGEAVQGVQGSAGNVNYGGHPGLKAQAPAHDQYGRQGSAPYYPPVSQYGFNPRTNRYQSF